MFLWKSPGNVNQNILEFFYGISLGKQSQSPPADYFESFKGLTSEVYLGVSPESSPAMFVGPTL